MAAAMDLKAIQNLKVSEGTNILDIEIPAQLETSIDTGIGFLNDAFGGTGMTPSTCAILTGDPGAGKTTLMLQLAESMTRMGHQPVYNGREEAVEQMRKVTKRLGFTHGFVVGQERMVPLLIDQLASLRRSEEVKCKERHESAMIDWNQRKQSAVISGTAFDVLPPVISIPPQQILILDSLQSHDDGFYKDGGTNSMTQVRVTEQITDWCKSTYGIAIMIGQVTKSGKVAGKQQIIHTIDVHAHMTMERDSDAEFFGCRLFGMQKNRWGCNGVSYALDLTKFGFKERGQIGSLLNDADE